jgi:hypothetical protein
MRIANHRPLKELKAEFRSEFPYLDIYFFKKGASLPVSELFEPEVKVGDVRDDGLTGELRLNGNLSATAIEQTMSDIFGLSMRIGYDKEFRHRFIPSNKPLNELYYRSMHLMEEVVIV